MSIALIFVVIAAASIPSAVDSAQVGSFVCPTPGIGITCFCTHGCGSQLGGLGSWSPSSFPPTTITVGSPGAVCVKLTFPLLSTSIAQGISAAVGSAGQVTTDSPAYLSANINSEVSVWTAMNTTQCASLGQLLLGLSATLPAAAGLGVVACNTDRCNEPKSTSFFLSPFPGSCPVPAVAPISCYCTSSCAVSAAAAWTPGVWPPALQATAKTICARIEVPVVDSDAGRDLAAFLGISGDIFATSLPEDSYAGAAPGSTITIYTAFTASECATYAQKAAALGTGGATGALLCSTTGCNIVPAPPAPSSVPYAGGVSYGCVIDDDATVDQCDPVSGEITPMRLRDLGVDSVGTRTLPHVRSSVGCEPVLTWLHRSVGVQIVDDDALEVCIDCAGQRRCVAVTGDHLIQDTLGDSHYPRHLRMGHTRLNCAGTRLPNATGVVVSVAPLTPDQMRNLRGMYVPLTRSGLFYVNGVEVTSYWWDVKLLGWRMTKLLPHVPVPPRIMSFARFVVLSLEPLFVLSDTTVFYTQDEWIHPFAVMLYRSCVISAAFVALFILQRGADLLACVTPLVPRLPWQVYSVGAIVVGGAAAASM